MSGRNDSYSGSNPLGASSHVAGVELTHLDRVFWPESGLRKRDLVEYYQTMAPVLLPHVRNRPFTIKRHYTVPRGPFEWVKDTPAEAPRWIRTCPQPAKSRGGKLVRYPLVNSQGRCCG